MFHPDDKIGPYSLLRSLGRGSFGEVWLAQRRGSLLTTQVALKLPLETEPDLALIEAEAQIWLRASGHPNVVPVLEAEVYGGQVVIASEYVAGGSLADWLKRHGGRAPSLEAAVGMLRAILAGLEHLHSNQLIHRDLKPCNVLLQSGIPRLTDFGLARVLKTARQTSSLSGTPAYMAPESFQGHYSAASDIWAAGVLLYEMVSGSLPFPQANLYAVLLAVTGPDMPPALSDNVPAAVRAVVMRALAKSPGNRFESAVQMELALAAALSPRQVNTGASSPVHAPPPVGHDASFEPPSGTVTFLFTDIEGSTTLWERYPNQMRNALSRHDALIRNAVKQHAGYMFKSAGDAFCAVFRTAPDAVAASIEAQCGLHAENWPDQTPLHVRMALHTGTAELRDNDYFGQPLNRVARLLAVGHGGQVLLSDVTRQLIPDALSPSTSFKSLGKHRLKDLGQPETVFQIVHGDLGADFPPLRSLDNPALPNNLPQQLTSFVGREAEMDSVKSLFSKTRLLTLTGSGGCGKTRLSLQVAADMLDGGGDGVWLVELAPLSDSNLVLQTIANVLNVTEQPGTALMQTLIAHVKSKKLILLLDNCEHMLEACGTICDALLRASSEVKILASSREALGIGGEAVYRVPSLTLPDTGQVHTPESLEQYEAVRLFVERACAVATDFVITPTNADAVARACKRLDGIPLAIELAAVRVRSLTVEQIASRLDDRFRLLTGGSRTALPRQQTLRALIDWSYSLLNPAEKLLLCRLSVFVGGWTLEAAEAICDSGSGAGSMGVDDRNQELADQPLDVLELLTSLVDKSLVVAEREGDAVRYRLLETVAQYARDRLMDRDDGTIPRVRHRDFFLALAEHLDPQLLQSNQSEILARMETEHANFRAAQDYARESEQPEICLRLATSLFRFWYTHGHFLEGRARLTEALALASEGPPCEATAKAYNALAGLDVYSGEYRSARSHLENSLSIRRQLGDLRGIAIVLSNLGIIETQLSEFTKSEALLQEALALQRSEGDFVQLVATLTNAGYNAAMRKDYAAARAYNEESLLLSHQQGNWRGAAHALDNLSDIARNEGDYELAHARGAEALQIVSKQGDRRLVAQCLEGIARLAAARGNADRAVRLFAFEDALRKAIGSPMPAVEQENQERCLAAARSALDEQGFASAWRAGHSMSMEQAVNYALGTSSDSQGG